MMNFVIFFNTKFIQVRYNITFRANYHCQNFPKYGTFRLYIDLALEYLLSFQIIFENNAPNRILNFTTCRGISLLACNHFLTR